QVVQDYEVSEANPFHQAIKDYANKRLIQLSNSLNFLGYSNTYVPPDRFAGLNDNDSLFGLARTRLSAALRGKADLERYLQAAEQTQRAAAEAQNGADTAKASIGSAEEKRKLAGVRRDGASARLKSIKSKNGILNGATLRDLVIAAAATVAAAA